MGRRMALTSMTIIFTYPQSLILFSLMVACLAVVAHQEVKAYMESSINTLVNIEHWQNLLCILVLLIRDGQMFEGMDPNILSVILLSTNR